MSSRDYVYTANRGVQNYYDLRKITPTSTLPTSERIRIFRNDYYTNWTPTWSDEAKSSYLRPIITISSKLIPIDGTGTKENAYIYE